MSSITCLSLTATYMYQILRTRVIITHRTKMAHNYRLSFVIPPQAIFILVTIGLDSAFGATGSYPPRKGGGPTKLSHGIKVGVYPSVITYADYVNKERRSMAFGLILVKLLLSVQALVEMAVSMRILYTLLSYCLEIHSPLTTTIQKNLTSQMLLRQHLRRRHLLRRPQLYQPPQSCQFLRLPLRDERSPRLVSVTSIFLRT